MALSRQKKTEIVTEISDLLASSKLTVIAKYQGTSVKSMQDLRRASSESGTQLRVVKNRLFKRVLASDGRFNDVDPQILTGQLLYAFNANDEVSPAQNLANFAKTETQIEFVGGLNADGNFLEAADVKALAALPGKDQLRAQLVGTINAPLSGLANVLAANIRGVMNVLNARAEQI